VFCDYPYDDFGNWNGWNYPARQTLTACGYDPTCYISTAQLVPSPYTNQALIQAKLGGLIKLIEACDDDVPPQGELTGDALAVYNNLLQNVTTEINGYLAPIYPIPLAQTGTVAVLQVTSVSTDGLGTVTGISVLWAGNYLTAPATANNPVYLRYIDPLLNAQCWGECWQTCQTGTGLQLTVAYSQVPYSDESGQVLQANTVNGIPAIAVGGLNYQVNDIVVLTGGSSFVPAKIREAMLSLVCHDLYQRRIAPEEKNMFALNNKIWRGNGEEIGILQKIGNGDDGAQLDGTYKRNFSIGAVWGQRSVLQGNSL
jgi:hypothetical protein